MPKKPSRSRLDSSGDTRTYRSISNKISKTNSLVCLYAHIRNIVATTLFMKYLTPLLAAFVATAATLHGQSITVPNFSFESATAPNSYPFVNTSISGWTKAAEPAYYAPAIGTPFGIPWEGTAGVFLDVNPYANHDGSQAGYLLGFPQVELYQDYDTSAGHDLNATFEVGKGYQLTLGLFGKNLAPGSTLQLGLYYKDSGSRVIVGSTSVVYSSSTFVNSGTLNLIDYTVNIPTVQAGDAWAGHTIGIQLLSTTPIEMATGGNWDFDNARLAAVPEPATVGLLSLGFAGLIRRRSRRPSRA